MLLKFVPFAKNNLGGFEAARRALMRNRLNLIFKGFMKKKCARPRARGNGGKQGRTKILILIIDKLLVIKNTPAGRPEQGTGKKQTWNNM